MKKIMTFIMAVLMICTMTSGCTQNADDYDYKEAYDRLYTQVENKNDLLEGIDGIQDSALKKFDGELCVCLGDYVLGAIDPPEDYATVIAEETGLQTVNAGIASSWISAHANLELDTFSLYRLADAIATGDWTLQDAAVASLPLANSATHYQALKGVDWTQADIITIGMGQLDISGSAVLDDPAAPKSTSTVLGALRYSIERILAAYPHIKIMILTPTYRYLTDKGVGCDQTTFGEHTYGEYTDGIISVAREYNLPYVDLYRSLGINSINYAYYTVEGDGALLNTQGTQRLGKRVADALLLEF